MSNENNNYESKYIYNILQINKSLRNEIEVIYKLLRQKLKMETSSNLNSTIETKNEEQINNKYLIKLNNLINEFEIILSNLGIQMESHNELIIILNTIEEKYKTIQKNTLLMNEINDLQKKQKIIKIQNNEYKLKYENILKELDLDKKNFLNMKKTNEFLNKENIDLRLQIERYLKEKKEMYNIITQVETMGDKLKEVEKKYKDKLKQKDSIISQLDIQLQQYEIQIKKLQKELLINKIQINKNNDEKNNDCLINGDKNNNSNTNNSTSLYSNVNMNNNIKIINSMLNNSLKNSKNNVNENENKNCDRNKKNKSEKKECFIKENNSININKNDENENNNYIGNSESNNDEIEEEENIDELLKEVDEEINKSI